MELTLSDQGDYVLAKTSGPINDDAAEPVREHLRPLVAQGDAKIIIDIADSPRINSAGIAILVRLVSDANANAGRVLLAAPSPFVGNVFSVTKLTQFFEVVDSVKAAAEQIQQPKSA